MNQLTHGLEILESMKFAVSLHMPSSHLFHASKRGNHFLVASTDSDSFVSDLRALPMQVKGMGRRNYQQQYLMTQGE